MRWRFKTGDDVKGHPSIAEDGTIYVGSFDYLLYAINPNGTLKWKRDGDYCGSSSVAIGNDGILYFGSLYAAYPNNGTTKWSLDLPNNYFSSHAISADGTIYVSAGGCLIAVNPNGTEKWRKYIGKAESCPVIAEDGTIYIGSGQDDFGYLHAFGKGPLAVDAGGPYSGNAEEPIQFSGDVFGGVLPYDYHWEFGDGNTSDLEDPEHTYSESGEYIATFTVIDGDENSSSDTANVTVGTSRPTVKITKPENALYLLNMKILPLSKPLIIGRIDIEVDASQGEVGIDRVEFYIDDELKFTDFDEPYSWTWKDKVFFKHTIKVIAIDNAEKSSSNEIVVRKFF